MKHCPVCDTPKPEDEFHKNKRRSDGLDRMCKVCKGAAYKERRAADPLRSYFIAKRSECTQKGIPFDLDEDYLRSIWTNTCPIFGTPISLCTGTGRGSSQSAHLDRFTPERGYVKGNIAWISGRANRIKYDATAEELEAIVRWMRTGAIAIELQ